MHGRKSARGGWTAYTPKFGRQRNQIHSTRSTLACVLDFDYQKLHWQHYPALHRWGLEAMAQRYKKKRAEPTHPLLLWRECAIARFTLT